MLDPKLPSAMTLPEAQALLLRIGYRDTWTAAELHAAAAVLPRRERGLLPVALRVVAAGLLDEADRQERDR